MSFPPTPRNFKKKVPPPTEMFEFFLGSVRSFWCVEFRSGVFATSLATQSISYDVAKKPGTFQGNRLAQKEVNPRKKFLPPKIWGALDSLYQVYHIYNSVFLDLKDEGLPTLQILATRHITKWQKLHLLMNPLFL